jgi:glycosyltransferase involved in cell wall biosynthesis
MKILLIGSSLRENDAISDHLVWQANTLSEALFEVTVLSTNVDKTVKSNLESTIQIFETLDPILILALINKAQMVIVHFGIYSQIFEILAVVPSSKIVFWDHNVTPVSLFDDKTKPLIYKSLSQRKLLSRAKQIVTDSLFTAQDWPDRDVIVSAPPLRQDFVGNFLRNFQTSPSKSISIIAVGRFTSSKGGGELLTVLNDPALDFVHFHVVIPANGNDVALTKRLLKIKRSNVSVHINLETSALAGLYSATNYFLSLSKHEGLGLGQIEALASGCVPIVWPGAGASAFIVTPEIGLHLASPTAADVRRKIINEIKPFSDKNEGGVLAEVGPVELGKWTSERAKVVSRYLPNIQEKILLQILKEEGR